MRTETRDLAAPCAHRSQWPSRMGGPLLAGLLISASLVAPSLHGELPAETVLASMDAAAANWKAMRAKVEWVRYMALVDDRTVESGRIVVRLERDGSVAMLIRFEQPTEYFFSVRGAKVEIYKPRIQIVEVYDLSQSRNRLENALLLGFGTQGRYLQRHYRVGVEGEEEVSGHAAVKLALEPRNPEGELNGSPLEMWISKEHWQPVRQKVVDPRTGDYRTYSYTEMEINPQLGSAAFRLPLAPGTKRVRPQR